MTQILLDANLARQLKAAANPLELCDPAGEVVGHFTPVSKPKINPLELCDPTGKVVGHFTPGSKPKINVPFTEEEIKKSKQKTGGRPLADILADLEKA